MLLLFSRGGVRFLVLYAVLVVLILLGLLAGEVRGATSDEHWGAGRVRYGGTVTSLRGNSMRSSFGVGEKVQLLYLSENNYTTAASAKASVAASTVVWSVEGTGSVCTLDGSVGAAANLTCSEAGPRKIQTTRAGGGISNNVTDTFYISFGARQECYNWHYVFVSGEEVLPAVPVDTTHSAKSITTVQLRVWVVDETLTQETGAVPSVRALPLTARYQSLGEVPSVALKGVIVPSFASTPMSFNETESFWYTQFTLPSVGFWTHLDLIGKSVASLGCTVESKMAEPLAISKYQVVTQSAAPASGGVNTTSFSLHQDACARSIIAIAAHTHVLLSEDFLKGFSWLNVGSAADPVTAVALSASNMVFLKSTGVYTLNQTSGAALVLSTWSTGGFPPDVDHIHSQGACNALATVDNELAPSNHFVTAWGSKNGTHFFTSSDGGRSFTAVALPQSYGAVSATHAVHDTAGRYDVVAVVSSSSSSSDFVLLRQRVTGAWSQGHIFDSTTRLLGQKTSSAILHGVISGSGELLLGGDQLFYSPDNGITAQAIVFRNRDPSTAPSGSLTGLGAQEYITQIATHSEGGFAVFTSFVRLFYGVLTDQHAVELQAGESPATYPTLTFSSPSALYVVTAQSPTSVTRRLYPLGVELRSPKVPSVFNPTSSQSCPYAEEDVSVNVSLSELVYLDMTDTINIRASITSNASSPNFMSFAVSDVSLLSLDTISSITRSPYDTSQLLFTREVSVKESPLTYSDRAARLATAQGTASVRAMSSLSNVLCTSPQHVMPVRVGCPPKRHIRVRQSVCDGWTPSAATTRSVSLEGENRDYLRTVFGCLIRVFHGTEGWKPTVDLYDGDVFVREVDADFIVWETRGRSGFTFNATAGRAGCISQPLTWGSIMAGRTYGSPAQDSLWTPENQVNCFVSDASRPLVSGGYNVMNRTGPNYLTFDPKGDDGLFLFKLRVVDPSFSFCELTTHFALDVYGAPLDVITTIIIVMSVTAVIAVALGFSYLHYRQKLRLKKDV